MMIGTQTGNRNARLPHVILVLSEMVARLRETILDHEQGHQRSDGFSDCLVRHLGHLRLLLCRHRRHRRGRTVLRYKVR